MGQDASVLVVDDVADIRDLIATVLKEDGYTVASASDGAEALRKVGECEPDAIILDARMPTMDGWEFLALWRTRPAVDRAPVLVLSAVCDRQSALESGAQAFVAKPFDIETLEAALARMVSGSPRQL